MPETLTLPQSIDDALKEMDRAAGFYYGDRTHYYRITYDKKWQAVRAAVATEIERLTKQRGKWNARLEDHEDA